MADLAPFGGITRIRFKGFPALCEQGAGSQPKRLPRSSCIQNKTRIREVNDDDK